MRPSHDSVRRSESSLHTVGPPVLLNSIIGTPGGRYMRLVTPLRAPFAAPIAPSHRGGLVQNRPPRHRLRVVCQLFVDSAYDESFRCDNFVQTISVLHKGTTAKRLVTVNYVPSTAFMNRFTLIGAAAHCSVPPLHT